MMITLNPADENSLLTGLDFALTTLAFEQSLKIVFICAGERQKLKLTLRATSKLKSLQEIGLDTVHHLEWMAVQNIPDNLPSKVLSAFEYANTAKNSRDIVSF